MAQYIANFVGVTHVGKRRGENRDNLYFNMPPPSVGSIQSPRGFIQTSVRPPFLLAVCDGMDSETGAAAAYAAAAAIDDFRYALMLDFTNNIQNYIVEANRRICDMLHVGGRISGTTIAMVCMTREGLHCANVGNSRIYRLRGGDLRQISEDHSRAGLLRKLKIERPSGNSDAPTLFLGMPYDELFVVPSCSRIDDVQKGDIYLICSDGLTDMLGDADLARIITSAKTEAAASDALLGAALERGGADNITYILLRIVKGTPKVKPKRK